MRFPYFKAYFLEVVGQRRRLKALKKNLIFFFYIEFFKYFFRVLHEASSS
jgi:hypothetical protein